VIGFATSRVCASAWTRLCTPNHARPPLISSKLANKVGHGFPDFRPAGLLDEVAAFHAHFGLNINPSKKVANRPLAMKPGSPLTQSFGTKLSLSPSEKSETIFTTSGGD